MDNNNLLPFCSVSPDYSLDLALPAIRKFQFALSAT
jgi:hypothetical protein